MPPLLKPLPRACEKREQARDKARAWKALRRVVLERDSWRCRVCGTGNGPLDVHHIRPKSVAPKHVTAAGLITLCRCCHGLVGTYRLTLHFGAKLADGPMTCSEVRHQ